MSHEHTSKTVEEIFAESQDLTDEERERLVELLDQSSGSGFATREIEEAWIQEANRVSRAVAQGKAATFPADEVMRELREIVDDTNPE